MNNLLTSKFDSEEEDEDYIPDEGIDTLFIKINFIDR